MKTYLAGGVLLLLVILGLFIQFRDGDEFLRMLVTFLIVWGGFGVLMSTELKVATVIGWMLAIQAVVVAVGIRFDAIDVVVIASGSFWCLVGLVWVSIWISFKAAKEVIEEQHRDGSPS